MLRKTIILMAIPLVLIAGAGAWEVFYTQEQLDNIDVDSQINYQSLLCHVLTYKNGSVQDATLDDQLVFYFDGDLYTLYSCLDIERAGELRYRIHNDSIFYTIVPFEDGIKCLGLYNQSVCEQWYWEQVIAQAFTNVEQIKDRFRDFQTKDGYWEDWWYDIFE